MAIMDKQNLFLKLNNAALLFLACTGLSFGQFKWVLESSSPTSSAFSSVTYGGGQFIAVWNSDTIATSPDGSTWTRKYSGTTSSFNYVTWCNNRFVATGSGGPSISTSMISLDGVTWTARNLVTNNGIFAISAVAYGARRYVGVGEDDDTITPGTIFTSLDGLAWTTVRGNANATSVIYSAGMFVAVAEEPNPILTSTDGLTWKTRYPDSAPGYLFCSVTYGGGRFVAVGYHGMIYTSVDDSTWKYRTPGTAATLFSVAYGNGYYVAVGINGYSGSILTSPDGLTWTEANLGAIQNTLYSVTYGNGRFIAVGSGGAILSSNGNPTGTSIQSPPTIVEINKIKASVVHGFMYVAVPSIAARSPLRIAMLTTAGKKVYSAICNAHQRILTFPSARFPTGIYLLSITDDNNRSLSSPVVLPK